MPPCASAWEEVKTWVKSQWKNPRPPGQISVEINTREALGVWGSITIEQARTAARARLGDVARGVDVVGERRRRREAEEAARAEAALTLGRLIEGWQALHLSIRRPRYAAEAVRALRYAFAADLAKPAAKLSRAAVVEILDGMTKRGAATTAGRTLAYGRAAFAWAAKRGMVPGNPFTALPVTAATSERERVLDDAEVAEVWAAAGTLPYPWGPFFRLALLTLQRRDEAAGIRWSELSADLSMWRIPGPRMKTGKPHDVHLSEAARAVLRTVPRVEGQDLLFTGTGRTAVSGFSKAKRQLDDAIAAARADAGIATPMPPWRLHDFRRTGVTRLAAMGIDSIVADKLLAHQPARLRGVASVYQRHGFGPERARALDAWGAHVAGTGEGENVVRMARVG